ncbi:hypothetical protein VA596_47290 [Amycolatopsis sp., V23-08]|uniref:Uncharacterized protein n=1 Tax=Amycolatopsis heterodermiae TaxID=3110235 RepID=A0ABU5RNQ7_9PSEU|nr:hypothetical protein [Amycolatopsis sp., V23-08]MEA5367204.1 hypothetical protein [Amycolatopsis sp., V23-08]
MSCHEPGTEFLGLDFAARHQIRCSSWDLGTFRRGEHVRQEWAVRMQRQDHNRVSRSLTWVYESNPGETTPDWDWVIFLLARDAGDGRLSFDAYIDENLTRNDGDDIRRYEHQRWVRAEYLWHQVRDFLGRDPALIASLFAVVPPEH